MKHSLTLLTMLLLASLSPVLAASSVFDPCDFGAKSDGQTLCTEAIQKAIDACAAAGGGTVRLAGGTFRSGTVFMKSGVTLDLASGSTLLGSTNLGDYPATTPAIQSRVNLYCTRSLIYAENLDRIAIEGAGTLDGSGAAFYKKTPSYLDRPFLLRVINCRNVRVENIRMQNSGCWNQHYLACEGVRVRGIRVWNYSNRNNDGIDIDGCRDFEVSRCEFSSSDDAICLKSTLDRACENIRISDCIASSHANAIKMGTDSTAGFVDVTITNCIVRSPPPDAKRFCGRNRGIAALALEIVDGGRMERIVASNLKIDGVEVPIFVRLGNRGQGWLPPGATPGPAPKVGTVRGITLSNIVATNAGLIGSSITGIPGHRVEDVTLSNINISSDGGGKKEWADALIEERAERYPEATMFGHLPAYGFYCRHVKGLRFSNVRLRTAAADLRHAMVFDDAENVTINGLDAAFWPGGAPMLMLTQVHDAVIRGCQPRVKDGTFLKLAGDKSRNIALIANDLSGVTKAVDAAPEVPKDALSVK